MPSEILENISLYCLISLAYFRLVTTVIVYQFSSIEQQYSIDTLHALHALKVAPRSTMNTNGGTENYSEV